MMAFYIIFVSYLLLVLVVGRQLAFNDVLPRKIPAKIQLNGYAVEDLKLIGDGRIIIHGWLIKSPHNTDHKTIILLHGWMMSRSDLIRHIKLLADHGYHVCAYDQRSHGGSHRGLVTYGKAEGLDLLSVIEQLRLRSDINCERLGAVAFSLGTGTIVAAAAQQKGNLFRAVVLEGVFDNSYAVGEKILKNYFGNILGKMVGCLFFNPGIAIWSRGRFKHFPCSEKVKGIINLPTLIIRGDNDAFVTKKSAHQFIASVQEPKEIWIHSENQPVSALGHINALQLFPHEYRRRVIGFLDKNI